MDYWLGSVYPRLMVDPAERMDNLFLLETLHKFFTQLTQLTQSTHSLSVPFDIWHHATQACNDCIAIHTTNATHSCNSQNSYSLLFNGFADWPSTSMVFHWFIPNSGTMVHDGFGYEKTKKRVNAACRIFRQICVSCWMLSMYQFILSTLGKGTRKKPVFFMVVYYIGGGQRG